MRSIRTIGLVAVCNTAGGLTPALMSYLFAGNESWPRLVEQAKWGLVFAWCIGTLCFVVVEKLARRVRRLRRHYQVPAFLVLFAGLAMLGSIPAILILVLTGWLSPAYLWKGYLHGTRAAIAITVPLGGIITAFEIVLHRLDAATLELRNGQLAEERARKLAAEARLTALEARIHPHFLFNTLNSISALIREDPRAAERMVERLAALLRASLELNQTRLAPLSRELRNVEDYLEIEKTRFAGRLQYTINIPADAADVPVPPFCLQTLVENSVKHVAAQRREGAAITISARLDHGEAILEVSDDGPGFDASDVVPGHGLDNLQGRIATLFDGAGRLEILSRHGGSRVEVHIPRVGASA